MTHSPHLSWNSLPKDEAITETTINLLIVTNIVWFIMFFVVGKYHPLPAKLTAKCNDYDKFVLRHRIVTIYHGLSAFSLSLYWHLALNDRSCSKKNSTFELLTITNTFSHFIWDIIYMKYFNFLDTGNLIHHLLGITCYSSLFFQQHNINVIMLNLLPAETTNVNMHLREIFKRFGMRYTRAYYFNEYQYSYLYMLCRTFWIPLAFYWMYTCDSTNIVVLIFYPCHIVMSWYYVSLLPGLVRARGKELKKFKDAKIALNWFTPISNDKVKEAGVNGNFEAYKM